MREQIGRAIQNALDLAKDDDDIDTILYLIYAYGDGDMDAHELIMKLEAWPLSRW